MDYASKHLAQNAICRLYDRGEITFEQWLSAQAVEVNGRYTIKLENTHKESNND